MRYFFCLLLCACPIYGQSITLHNGSVLKGKINLPLLQLETKHGLLKIPYEDIRGVEVGLHPEPGVKEQIEVKLKQLGSPIHKERELAQSDLIKFGKQAIPFLAIKEPDSEVSGRIKFISEKIHEDDPKSYREDDLVKVKGGEYRGKIILDGVIIKNKDFGDLKLKLGSIAKISVLTQVFIEVNTDEEWIDTGFIAEGKFNLQATGTIDIYPATPNQYMSGPEGATNTLGRNNLGRAGELLVKIGNQPIRLSELNRSTYTGNVYLMIVQNPWGTKSSGSYKVTITGE